MEATTSFESDNKLISLDNKNCTIGRDKKSVTCSSILSCLKYNGINLPTSIDIEISWVLDSKKPKTPRLFFLNDDGKNIRNSTMRLYRGKQECRTEVVYVADGIRDKLTPLEVEMKYNIRQSTTAYSSTTVSRRRRATLEPVLDENRGTVQHDSINIMKNCGKDNICIPDLKLAVKTDDKYVLGANESLTVEVMITNPGEDAFEASFFMNIPQGVDYKSTKRIGDQRDTSYTCTAPSFQTNNTLKCDIGNPLPAGKSVNFKVFMEPSKRGGKSAVSPNYDFYMEVNSTNPEADGSSTDNRVMKSVKIFVESDLSISGRSTPSEFHYNVTQYKDFNNATHEGDLGPQMVHVYDLRNNGTSRIEEIEVYIYWPAQTLDDEPLMYLLNQPETLGPITCDQSQFVHSRYSRKTDIERDTALEKKSYLEPGRTPIRQFDTSFSSNTRPNTQEIANNEDESQESAGDASDVHKQRESDSGHFESWSTGGHQSGSASSGSRQSGSAVSESRQSGSATSGSRQSGSATSGNFQSGSSSGGSFQSGSNASGSRQLGSASGSGSRHYSSSSSSGSQVSGSASSGGRQPSGVGVTVGDERQGPNFKWNSIDGVVSKDLAQSSGSRGSSSSSVYRGGQQGSVSSVSQHGSSSHGSYGASSGVTQSSFDRSSQSEYDRAAGSSSSHSSIGGGSVGGSNAREYEYRETWNSSSVNGGPLVTHHASKNRTVIRGQDGRVSVSETSTERVITGGASGTRSENRESSYGSRHQEDTSSSVSQVEYDRLQREYYEEQKRYQEEQRRRQMEERVRHQEDQRRREQESYRLEEERRILDEERRRTQSSFSSRTQGHSQGSGSSGYESSYNRQTENRASAGSSGGSR